jgi:WD40 repeat protein
MSFFFINVFVFNPTIASQTTNALTCLDISSTNPLTEQYVFEPVDPETIVSELKWSPDGTSLSASYVDTPVTDRSERIHLWDLATGESGIVFSRIDEPYAVTPSRIEWSPDGSRLALSSTGTEQIVTIGDDNIISLESDPIGIARLVWSPDSTHLASIEENDTIRIWDADTGQERNSLSANGHALGLRGAWSDQGLRWLTQDEQETIRVWEEGHDEPLFTLRPDYYPSITWLSPSGEMLAIADDFVELWDVENGQLLQTLDTPVRDIAWSPDENCIVTATLDTPDLPSYSTLTPQIWEVETGELLQTIDAAMEGVGKIAWSPDGTSLAYIDETGAIHVWGLPQS